MHHTEHQDVVNAKNKLADLKSAYMDSIARYINHKKGSTDFGLSEILDCQKSGNEYFNYAEEFVGNSDLLGAHNSSLWAQGFAEDCAEILKSMPAHFKLLSDGFSKANSQAINHVLPGSTAYANMQRMVAKYLTSSESNEIKQVFIHSNLSTYGFDNQEKDFMSKKLQTILSFSFGVIFIVVMLVIAVFLPYPTAFQLFTFRITLALAAGGVAAMLPGFITVTVSSYIRSSGALAGFVIIYFFNPATLIVQGEATNVNGLFVKQLSEEKGLVEYYWKQGDLKFRFPTNNWTISTKAATAGLGDLVLEHSSGKNAQMQMHVSLLDDKYRGKWDEFERNIISLWKGTIQQFGQFSSENTYLDGRTAFIVHGTVRGEIQGSKIIDLVYAPLGDNRLFEIHLTRNKDNQNERELTAAYNLVKSTIKFDRN
jgi:hypothetical protein